MDIERDPIKQFQQIREELKNPPQIASEEKHSARYILAEVVYSFLISTMLALSVLILFVSMNQNAKANIVGQLALWSLIIGTVLIYIFRQIVSRRSLAYIGAFFLSLLILFGFTSYAASGIICHQEKGSWGYEYSIGDIYDINGNVVSHNNTRYSFLDTVCYIPQSSVARLQEKQNTSFLYSLVIFVHK